MFRHIVLLVTVTNALSYNVTNRFEFSHQWLHHEMAPEELSAHFGMFDPKDIDPESYRVITVQNIYNFHSEGSDVPPKRNVQDPTPTLEMTAFGQTFNLPLKPTPNLLSPYAEIVDTFTDPETGKLSKRKISVVDNPDEFPKQDCHFSHHSDQLGAAFSNCDDANHFQGFITDNENVYEVHPVHPRHHGKLNQLDKRSGEKTNYHIITKKSIAGFRLPDQINFHAGDKEVVPSEISRVGPAKHKRGSSVKMVETALFLDKPAYDMYMKFFDGDKQKIRNLLLTFVNGIQAIYHYPKLRTFVDFTIVYIELMETQAFNTGGSERTQLLTNFCDYQAKKNPGEDSDPKHWDVGLYLSGLDFWAVEGGQRSTITMGLATVTGMCTKEYGCVIGEIGVLNQEGRPYPSTGFTSVFVMAHEVGHNFGMTHDHTAGCDKDGYVMSFSRGTKGEVLWSTCSADVMDKLNLPCLDETSAPPAPEFDHMAKYKNVPGLIWSAVEQCQFLLQDKRAKVNHDSIDMPEMCNRLLCRLDEAGTNGYFAAGPALEGTACRNDSKSNTAFCVQGSCVDRKDLQNLITAAPEQNKLTEAKWTDWHQGPCYSGCIAKSKGARTRRRTCQIPKPALSPATCQGPTTDVQLCDDFTPCASKPVPVADYASEMCQAYQTTAASLTSVLTGDGKQPAHNPQRAEQACTIYCKSKAGDWYSPQLELSRYPDVDLFFPDGTWCHNDGKDDFFCQQKECRPTSSRGARGDKSPDIKFLHNARPEETQIPEVVKQYFTLDNNDKPKNSDPNIFVSNKVPEEEFEQNEDSITIPEFKKIRTP